MFIQCAGANLLAERPQLSPEACEMRVTQRAPEKLSFKFNPADDHRLVKFRTELWILPHQYIRDFRSLIGIRRMRTLKKAP